MSDSSEEQIFNRRRISKKHLKTEKKDLENLFNEDEEDITDFVEDDQIEYAEYDKEEMNTIFYEIFGTGDEYMYVLEENEEISAEKNVSESSSESSVEIQEHFDLEEIVQWIQIRKEYPKKELDFFIQSLLENDFVHYILFHSLGVKFGIEEAYEIIDLYNEFKEFIKIKNMLLSKVNADELRNLNKFTKLNEVRDFSKYIFLKEKLSRFYDPCCETDLILSPNDFFENLLNKEKINEIQSENIPLDLFLETKGISKEYFKNYHSERLSILPIFQPFILEYCLKNGKFDEDLIHNLDIAKINDSDVLIVYDFENLLNEISKFYCIGTEDQWNKLRKEIISDVIKKIDIKEIIKSYFIDEIKNKIKKNLFVNVIDRIINGGIERPKYQQHVFGVSNDFKNVKVSVVNHKGESVESKTLGMNQNQDWLELYEKYAPICIGVSGSDYNIKNIFFRLKEIIPDANIILVENDIFKILSSDTSNFCYNIGLRILYPEILIMKMLKSNLFCEFVKNQNYLNNDEIKKQVIRGLLTAMSIVGIDINLVIENKNCHFLLETILGPKKTSKFLKFTNENGFIEKLSVLDDKKIFNSVEFKNISTYFRIFPDLHEFDTENVSDIIDSLSIHPTNYSYAKIFCTNLLKEQEIDDKQTQISLKKFVEDKKEVLDWGLAHVNTDDTTSRAMFYISECILEPKRPIFEGSPDILIFNNLFPLYEKLINKIFEGRVVKVGDAFCIVSVVTENNNFSVFASKSNEVFVNQFLKVKIEDINCSTLSFKGSLFVEEIKKVERLKFIEHSLFKNLNAKEAEKYLIDEKKPLIIRKSSRGNYAVITLKIFKDVFIHLRVDEIIENNKIFYILLGKKYDELDEILSTFIKSLLFNSKMIQEHDKYFDNEFDAQKYLKDSFDGVKVHYCFYFSRKYPGKVVFAYIGPNKILKEEYINLFEQLEFDNRKFNDIDEFLVYRKKRA
ncbi:putative SH2 domain-containing transcription elongation factor [Hamiltosporidium tvaerminnensis]|uniref:Putative SH2 domain-containing transcription elongation factor n=1 Tax=Hamiltosporidium tvaerminnensis TaxID=1176355 RepID=A0A4Q9M445_9MICR|nr:putative SH2 domain-containing transcription elongation factor [Hamiltosporidium tvaerminnensis]